jgi:hypothetical protein|tara:strand:- start:133 stop:336 length:204 start_codon:yes stop_codon:yes gene_type:complete
LQINPEKVLLLYLREDVGKIKRYRQQRFLQEASRFVGEKEFLWSLQTQRYIACSNSYYPDAINLYEK